MSEEGNIRAPIMAHSLHIVNAVTKVGLKGPGKVILRQKERVPSYDSERCRFIEDASLFERI